jgi:glyoxylase-like metal-dependent hydrolase (beta-lactamase superfamily II)
MIAQTQHDDVTELRLSSWKSRASSMAVSVFVCDGVLIDSGFPDVANELGAWIDANSIRGAIVTHAHEDHSGGVAMLAARGVAVHCASDTDALMRQEESVGLFRRLCWGPRQRLRAHFVPFVQRRFELRPARGHSSDHHVVWDSQTGTVFCGDLFIGLKLRVAHHDEDVRGQIAVLREVASWNPTRVFDAHRGVLPDPVASLLAKANWIEETVEEIESLARRGWDQRRIRNQVLGREDALGLVSFGDYSRLNFVRNVLRGTGQPSEATTKGSSA